MGADSGALRVITFSFSFPDHWNGCLLNLLVIHAHVQAKLHREMSNKDIDVLRKAWQNYSKNIAKAAVSVQDWVRKLEAMKAPTDPNNMHATCRASFDLYDAACHVAATAQEEYVASMIFLTEQSPATTMLQKAFMK